MTLRFSNFKPDVNIPPDYFLRIQWMINQPTDSIFLKYPSKPLEESIEIEKDLGLDFFSAFYITIVLKEPCHTRHPTGLKRLYTCWNSLLILSETWAWDILSGEESYETLEKARNEYEWPDFFYQQILVKVHQYYNTN